MSMNRAADNLVNELLNNRRKLVQWIIGNNFPAVARNMQQALNTDATFTPSGLESIIMAAKTPERIALMDKVLDVPWLESDDQAMNTFIQDMRERAAAAGSGSALPTRMAGADVAATGLIGLVGLVGGLLGGGRAQRDAERAEREAAAAAAAAAEKRRQLLIMAAVAIGVLLVVVILYKLARR